MQTYVVKAGDTLSKIAEDFYGDASLWETIFEENSDQIADPNKIRIGQKLRIPGASADVTPTRKPSTRIERGVDNSRAVSALQQNLVALGYELEVDGVFGKATDAAVRHLQEENGLTADGIVGPRTKALIAELLEAEGDEEAEDEEGDDEDEDESDEDDEEGDEDEEGDDEESDEDDEDDEESDEEDEEEEDE